MSNLSDKEIDRLSREAADFYEPDDSSLSWSRLEQKLTEQMPERPPDGFAFGRIKPYVWGPALVIIAAISFYLIKNNFYSQLSTRTVQPVNQTSASSSSNKNGAKGNVQEGIQGETTDEKDPRANSSAAETRNAGTLPGTGSAADNNRKARAGHSPDADAMSGEGVPRKTGRETNVPDSRVPASGYASNRSQAAISDGNNLNNSGLAKSGSIETPAATGSRIPYSLPPLAYAGAWLGTVKGNDSLLNRQGAMKTPVVGKTVHINRSLNFGFAFGPDYTDAGGIPNNQFGNNIGITVGYYLTSRLSVNSGIFYSNKFYWTPGYGPGRPMRMTNPPPVSAYAAAAPTYEFVNGSANLYELPLTLRYDIGNSGKSKFFANAGLSSYFIINQSSIYFFHSGGRPSAWKKTDNSQQNYWFDIADISLGVETDMGKGFSFQAEPFLKLPLKPMGMENAKLSTYGFLLSIRYTPELTKSKK
jgi:hypothetical protein